MSIFIEDATEIVDAAGIISRTLGGREGAGAKEGLVSATSPALRQGLAVPQPAEGAVAADQTVQLIDALRGVQRVGEVPFSQFAQSLPGTPLDVVGTVSEIAKKGWVEIKGDHASVRLTDLGRTVVDSLSGTLS